MVNSGTLYGSPKDVKVLWNELLPVPTWNDCEQVYVLVGFRYGRFFVISRLVEVPNRASNPREDFVVYTRDVNEVRKSLVPPETVIGYGHTHPALMNVPSGNDLKGLPSGVIGAVFCDGSIYWYTRKNRRKISSLR